MQGWSHCVCYDPRSGISDGWILQHIVPNMVAYGINPHACKVLGRALLWCLFDDVQRDCLPDALRQQMLLAYKGLGDRNTLPVDVNPVMVSWLIVLIMLAKFVYPLTHFLSASTL